MHYVLGVDGGASKTHALLVDERGHAIGFGRGGPSNYTVSSLESAMREIGRAVNAALEQGELQHRVVELGYFCLAGADLPEDFTVLQEALGKLEVVRRVVVKNDTIAALRAGTTQPWGIAIICGTGFNAAGRSRDGREIVLPGLGPISGDWGGGGALSEEMIRAVMRAWDGRGRPTMLTELVLGALNVSSEEALMLKLYHHEISRSSILNLVPLLFEAANTGDEIARDLVVRMGTEVGVTANALIRRLSLEADNFEVVLGGSVFKGQGPLLIETASQMVHQVAPRARMVRLHHEPVFGSALLALESIGVVVTDGVYQELDSSVRWLTAR